MLLVTRITELRLKVTGMVAILVTKIQWFSSVDQFQLVPSGGDTGPRKDQHGTNISVIYIRVQLREIKCMKVVIDF
jgi:hypothetical protein